MLWSDFAASNPRINFCSTISFILPSIFIFVVFILLDEFLLILSLNYTIRVFTLSNIVGRHWLISLKVKVPEAMLQSFVLSISFENGFINSFVRISFTSEHTSLICLFQMTVSIFIGFCELLSVHVTSFNPATYSAWPGLLMTHFSHVLPCFAKFLIPPTKVVTGIDLHSFFMHIEIIDKIKTRYILWYIFLSKRFAKHLRFGISIGFYWNTLVIIEIV